MRYKKSDPYVTATPQVEIDICESCPYPLPNCGANGCEHFKAQKAQILAARGDKRQLRGKLTGKA